VRRPQAGLTLIEMIMSMVVIGVGVFFFNDTATTEIYTSADPMQRKQALAVAESMLNEIVSKPFANPAGGFTGAATQANRVLFDDIGDYDGFATSGVYSIEGGALAALSAYGASVSVSAAALGSASLSVPSTDARLITVTVTYPGGSVSVSSYRTAYASDA